MLRAESFDFDGVTFSGEKNSHVQKVFTYHGVDPQDYIIPSVVPIARPVRSSYGMSLKEIGRYIDQLPASVSIDTWEYLMTRSADLYGNTGRPNAPIWRYTTEQILRRGDVFDCFKDIFYRPDGVTGVVSKGAAIAELLQRYDHVTHYDDDGYVIFPLARLFPAVDFVFVQGLRSGVLMKEDERTRFPNVTRIGQLRYEYEPSSVVQKDNTVEVVYPSYFEARNNE